MYCSWRRGRRGELNVLLRPFRHNLALPLRTRDGAHCANHGCCWHVQVLRLFWVVGVVVAALDVVAFKQCVIRPLSFYLLFVF